MIQVDAMIRLGPKLSGGYSYLDSYLNAPVQATRDEG